MKNKKKVVERVSAEGLLVALETAANAYLSQRASKGKQLTIEEVSLEINDSDIKVNNLGALVFAMTHPWVAIHTEMDDCSNSDEAHETEYRHLVEMTKGLLEARALGEIGYSNDEEDDD